MKKQDFLKKAKQRVSLEDHTTMHTASIADYLFEVETEDEAVSVLKEVCGLGLPFFILGKGSNTVLPTHYKGVVILMKMDCFEIMKKRENAVVFAQAGVFLPRLAREVTKVGAVGMEWAAGVPGTVGGAIRGNAGAFGSFIDSCITEVEAFDINAMQKEKFGNKECEFGYRDSIFKKRRDLVILRAEMKFPYGKEGEEKMEEFLRFRKDNHPTGFSSGSFFKNPKPKKEILESAKFSKFKNLGYIPAGFLIEESGLKGKKVGGAQISEKHANFIINRGDATREDIEKLVDIIKNKVKEKFSIKLEEEVELLL